tara:strand:+ start:264 stop:665 length:402 start_codon:yes stop_codon:yes gene_type:complete
MPGYGQCWTEHPYYEEISTLTRLSHDGHLNKKGREAYDKKIQEMFDEMYFNGWNTEGHEPKWESAKKAMLEGCDEQVYRDYSLELIDGKLYHYDDTESDGFGTCDMTKCNTETAVELWNGLCLDCHRGGPIDY